VDEAWSAADIGDQTGRVALVTGANSGIGFETTRALAERGAHVVMACRDEVAARRAYDALDYHLTYHFGRSSLEVLPLDLTDLPSVHDAASSFLARHARLDLLVNNAGIMGAPHQLTADGFELHMATNHLGHFALTGLLLDRIVTTERSRIVSVSSQVHRIGRVRRDDAAGARATNPWIAYGTSKLANLLFVAELQRRLTVDGLRTIAVAAHPGWTRSNLAGNGAELKGGRVRVKLAQAAGRTIGQWTSAGALPVLCAATSSSVHGGQYVGPGGVLELVGPPRVVTPSRRAQDPVAAAELWTESEKLTGVRYSVGVPA
jgi:NAD(P)-dependent dehydrogenase (short-subunit alcohol dehydrogenase family)